MTPAKVTVSQEWLSPENMRELVRAQGPCVTMFLPAYRPGEQAKSGATLLKSHLQEVTRQLTGMKIAESVVAELLDPLRSLADDPAVAGGSHWGRAIFRAPELIRQFHVTKPVRAAAIVGARFEIRPVLGELHLPAEFYLLKLSQKRAQLFRCRELHAESVALPKGVPETLDEAMALEPPDHDLENRSAAGASALRGVRFGTGSERETKNVHVADFYKIVDRGLHEILHGAPLVLLGVDEDAALYRHISTNRELLEKNLHPSRNGQIHEADILSACEIIRNAAVEREAKELASERFRTDLETILPSAFEGRVGKVYLDEEAEVLDSSGEEDLLNMVAALTLLHGGQAFALPRDRMPAGITIAAILRF